MPTDSVVSVRLPRAVADVAVPDSALALGAAELAAAAGPEALTNHCLRTYAFGALAAGRQGLAFDAEIAFVAAALHDLGLTDAHASADQRFELDGADAARRYLLERGVSAERAERAWDAVALHTSPGIALRKAPEVALVHLGAAMDVFGLGLEALPPQAVEQVLDAFPRLSFKSVIRDLLTDYVKRRPGPQTFTWTHDFAREHTSGCPSVSDALAHAPFEE